MGSNPTLSAILGTKLAQTSTEWSGPFVVMSTDCPRTFPEPSSSSVKLCAPTEEPYRVGYFKSRGIGSRSMTIPRQLALGEGKGQKEGKAQPKPRPVSPGRPRRECDKEKESQEGYPASYGRDEVRQDVARSSRTEGGGEGVRLFLVPQLYYG